MSHPQKEKIYCAKCSVDGAWYRALVTQVLPDRQVEVHYVDYGNSEKLSISSLREPAKAISHVNSLPFQVYHHCLKWLRLTLTVIFGRLPTRQITRTSGLLHTAKKKRSQQITRTLKAKKFVQRG